MRTRTTLACALALSAAAAAAQPVPADAIYLVRQEMSMDGHPGRSTQTSLNAVAVNPSPKGSSVTTRLLWAKQNGMGQSSSSLELDPADPDQRLVLSLLKPGFVMQLAQDGSVKDLRAKDEKAWQAVVQRQPRLGEMLAPTRQQAQGLRPLAVPAQLKVGQQLLQRETQPGHGQVSTRHTVQQITDEVVLLDTQLQGERLRGSGRQAVRRSDGMPIELDATFHHDADPAAGTPALTRRLVLLHITDEVPLDLALDDDIRQGHLHSLRDILAAPPYAGLTEDRQHFHLQTDREGELAPWMLSAETLSEFEKTLLFGVVDDAGSARPYIAMGGQVGPDAPPAPDGLWSPQVLNGVVKAVSLEDAAGKAITTLPAQVVVPRLTAYERWRSNETAANFPFRIPLDANREQLDTIERIAVQADVEVYHWAGTEVLARDTQSQQNTSLRVEWTSPQRLTVLVPRPADGERQGLWSVAIPLDANGQPLAAASLSYGRQLQAPGLADTDALSPLEWEHREAGWRQELATLQPIAAVKLLHYGWELQPRQWTFRNARRLQPEDVGITPAE